MEEREGGDREILIKLDRTHKRERESCGSLFSREMRRALLVRHDRFSREPYVFTRAKIV